MTDRETARPGLPIRIDISREQSSLPRFAPTAAFVSQLIVGRAAPVAQRRPINAVGAYRQSATSAVRRMPEGYRKTVVA
ncbi:hypothetical protein [Devosia soli]|nr:hypothetical protein [Devosia soli]